MDSYETILSRMQNKFTSLAGYSPDEASDIGIRMKVLAGEVYSLHSALEWLKQQTFAQTAQGEQLDLRAQERGITRKAPVAAKGTLVFSRATPLWYSAVVPAGTVCSTAGENPVRYVTLEDAVLPQGQLTVAVPAKAEKGGREGNAQPGTISVMVTPPVSMENVTNPQAFTGGEDSESDGELRTRLLQSYSGRNNGANAAFYREFALQYDGVYSVGVIPRENGPGTVGVYLGGRGTTPADEVVAQVQKDLDKAREINVAVHVAAAKTISVDVQIAVLPASGYSSEESIAAAQNAIKAYFRELSVGEPVLAAAMGASVLATGAVKNYAFTFCDRSVAANELAVSGVLTVLPLGGVA